MQPDERELDEELRAHLAISIRERIDDGESPDAARLAAVRELGYLPAVRESMRRVWHSELFDAAAALARDLRFASRSLLRSRGLAVTVIVTLALGIGANAAIFSLIRGVLLRPLVNRDEARLIYIRQSAPGLAKDNLTFSVPELADLESRVTSISAFGDFSTVDFAITGLGGEPRMVKAGVVNGSFFEVMGLKPVLGRLLNAQDDGPKAIGAAVLTYRFWMTTLGSDPHVIGRPIRLGARTATVVGVLEPSVPYPADTEIIANVVTSPHHLGALMTTNRSHRMTELFGRLAPGASLDQARAELTAAHQAMMAAHPEAYSAAAHVQVEVSTLRNQLAAPARSILLLLFGAAAIVFVIACANVANLILARSVRREGELAVRAALGAGPGALRRTLLAESLVLCGAGAVLGIVLARPLLAVLVRYAARFSVRANEATLDPSVVLVGAALAMIAAVLLAYVPRLPSTGAPAGLALANVVRVTPGARRRLRVFATTQIACSFVLLAAAAMLVATLVRLQSARSGYDAGQVLVFDIPGSSTGALDGSTLAFYEQATSRIRQLPGVVGAAVGSTVPWRDAGTMPWLQFTVDGYTRARGEEYPHANFRLVAPGFFEVLGVPLIAGRDFTEKDRAGSEPVAIVSQSLAQRLFPNGDAINGHLQWTDPLMAAFGVAPPRRIVGIIADVDDENVQPGSSMTVYQPVRQVGYAGRMFVHASGDPYVLVPSVRRVIRQLSPDQPVERIATLADVRAGVLSPQRLNALVMTGFAGIALLIAVIGVAGVLAFSVSARTREFGVRLAVGSAPPRLLIGVLSEGAAIAINGIAAGAIAGYAIVRAIALVGVPAQLPGLMPLTAAAALLIGAAVLASFMPAARAARVDIVRALRSE